MIDWKAERAELRGVHAAARRSACRSTRRWPISPAGEKQKLEILKQLYLKRSLLILDEPTSVLTPQEADEVLGLLRAHDARAAS